MNALKIRRASKLPAGYKRVRTARIRDGRSLALEDAVVEVKALHGDVVYMGGDSRYFVWAVRGAS